MPPTYATRADLHAHGLPRGVLVEQARLVSAVDPSSNRITLEAHGLETDDRVQFTAGDGGALPAGLDTTTVYYARPVSGSESLLEVSATAGGSAVDITTAGTSPFALVLALGPTIDAVLEYYSRYVDRHLIEHAVPLVAPYPTEVVAIVAQLAAAGLLRRLGQSIATVEDGARIARGELLTFSRGVPLRDARAPSASNMAAYYPMVSQRDDGTGLIP